MNKKNIFFIVMLFLLTSCFWNTNKPLQNIENQNSSWIIIENNNENIEFIPKYETITSEEEELSKDLNNLLNSIE